MTLETILGPFLGSYAGNPLVYGAVSLWGLGILTYLGRNIPRYVFEFLASQLTTKLTLDNAGWMGNELLFRAYLEWAHQNSNHKLTRTLMVESSSYGATKTAVGPGYGTHFFFYKGRLFWATLSKQENNLGERVTKTVSIKTFGRSHEIFERLLEEFRPLPEGEDALNIMKFDFESKDWQRVAYLQKRDLRTIAMNPQIKLRTCEAIERFAEKREWYLSKGIPHKLGVLLYGEPGNGKTSLVKALATKYKRDIYALNIRQMTDATLPIALASVPKGAFILCEDFDDSPAVKRRFSLSSMPSIKSDVGTGDIEAPAVEKRSVLQSATSAEDQHTEQSYGRLSMSTFLNAVDGIASLDNNILIFSTNHVENLDPAVLRKGRCDLRIELPKLTHTDIVEYLSFIYEDQLTPAALTVFHSLRFNALTGCDLQDLVLENIDSFSEFLSAAIERGFAKAIQENLMEYEITYTGMDGGRHTEFVTGGEEDKNKRVTFLEERGAHCINIYITNEEEE